jgi:hypothetical protein
LEASAADADASFLCFDFFFSGVDAAIEAAAGSDADAIEAADALAEAAGAGEWEAANAEIANKLATKAVIIFFIFVPL